MKPSILFAFCALITASPFSSSAHTLWIEPNDDNTMVLRFAEPDSKFETSPGHLDSLSVPNSFTVVTNTPVTVESSKKLDHFLLPGTSLTNVACTESTFTVRAARKPYFYARWQPEGAGAGRPLLNLDLVPTGKSGEVRVYFRGKPLGGAKAKLRTPDEKESDLLADTEGFIHFNPTQKGQYLLTVPHYRETLSGFHLGAPYQQSSHNAALTWRQQ
jgi:hypothetical protein